MKRIVIATLFVAVSLTTAAQDRIYIKRGGKIDCRLSVINYVEGIIRYRPTDTERFDSLRTALVDGFYLERDSCCYRPNKQGEFEAVAGDMITKPIGNDYLTAGVALRSYPLMAGGLTAAYTHLFDGKNGLQLTLLANRIYRRQEQLIVNGGQAYAFAEFTQHLYNYSTGSSIYWSLGAGGSYQGGDLWITGVEYSPLYGITIKEEGNDFHDWQFCLPQLTFAVGLELFNRSGKGAWDISIRYISPELRSGKLVSIREKLGFPNGVDGLYLTAGFRFRLR